MQGRAKTCGINGGRQVAEMFEVRLREGSLTVRLSLGESQGKLMKSLVDRGDCVVENSWKFMVSIKVV